jgi:hypothetical protein
MEITSLNLPPRKEIYFTKYLRIKNGLRVGRRIFTFGSRKLFYVNLRHRKGNTFQSSNGQVMVSRKYSTELMLRKELMKLWSMDLKEILRFFKQ